MEGDLVEPEVLARLAHTPVAARLPMQGTMSGRHQSPHRGSSVEFAEYRKYVPGDDTRRIDWRAYARSDRFYIKEFEADTNLRCCLVLDASGSMGVTGSSGISKWDYARRMAATLAHLIVQQGDAVGLYAGGPKLSLAIPPSRRPAHLMVINEGLTNLEPTDETGVVGYLHHLAEEVPQRAMVILLSDLFDDPDKIVDCWSHLRFRKHELVVFHLLDREELTFNLDQPFRFTDLESDDTIVAEPSLMASRYQDAVQRYRDRLREGAAQCQIDYQEAITDEPYGDLLARFLSQRLGVDS